VYFVFQELNVALKAHILKHSIRVVFLPIITKIYPWFSFEKSLKGRNYFLRSIHLLSLF
jgi:hypothetical protein